MLGAFAVLGFLVGIHPDGRRSSALMPAFRIGAWPSAWSFSASAASSRWRYLLCGRRCGVSMTVLRVTTRPEFYAPAWTPSLRLPCSAVCRVALANAAIRPVRQAFGLLRGEPHSA